MKLYTTRTFSAAHFLPDYIGQCSKMHGHSWKVEVWIEGTINPKTGMLVDFKDVKNVIDIFDHCVINTIISIPTAENIVKRLCYDIFYISVSRIDSVTVRVWESENSYAEEVIHRGDEEDVVKVSLATDRNFSSGIESSQGVFNEISGEVEYHQKWVKDVH